MSPNTPFWGQVKFALYGLAGLILAPFVAAVVLLAMATESIWRPIYNAIRNKSLQDERPPRPTPPPPPPPRK